MLASPITLLALLKAVAYGWQQHRMNENARQIAEVGQQFHERLQVFVDHLNDMSKALNKAVQEHNDVVGSFERRLLPSVRRLEGLVGAAQELAPPPVVDLSARAVTPEDA
jgi:DNA recombination protein RmuC